MGYLLVAPSSSSSLPSSPCLRTFGFSRSQLPFGQFGDHHAILLSHRQRELLNVSVRPKQIQLLVCPAYLRDIPDRVHRPSIDRGMKMLHHAVGDPKFRHGILMMKALVMLKKLAADGNNRRAMRSTVGLLSLVMAPLSSDFHCIDHDAWSRLAAVSLKLMWLLVYPSPQKGSTMKDEMAANKKEIKTSMNRIIKCGKCDKRLRRVANNIHKQV